ncbi:hypothetical protein CCM_00613 [Cordyceps militaris CM01]|uniref:Uncharacterized protein n=1 Tax=Cordyceps militaris (strain CM01) TaxID=983644 RepID=G3J545_CORMM|nr:uncharacterized protein CCM_00613 [Cordyceps militaris CM01]EGX95959.1 hypothetical protein CCM_00613 [Cordyceps militaris CM01]
MNQETYVAIHGASPRLTQEALHSLCLEMREAGWPTDHIITPHESGMRDSDAARIVDDVKEGHDAVAGAFCEPLEPGHRECNLHPSHISDDTTDFQYDGSDYAPLGKIPDSTTRWSWPRPINRRQKSSDCESEPASNRHQAWGKHREWVRGRLNHDGQLHQAVQRAQEKDRRLGLGHPAYGTMDVDAVSGAPSWAIMSNAPSKEYGSKETVVPVVPSCLPEQHQHVHDAKILAQYMAASAYTISLAGPPLPDMQYGIIIVPYGEEEMFFKQPEEPSFKKPSAAHVRQPSLHPCSDTSMGSTAFRFFNRQRLREMWEEDRWKAQLREQRRGLRVEDLLAPPDPWDDLFTDCAGPELQPWTSQEPDVCLHWDTDAPTNACGTTDSSSLLK